MPTEKAEPAQKNPVSLAPTGGALPQKVRLLGVSPQEPSWISLTLQLDAEHCHEPHFRWVSDSQTALTALNEESFDCVLLVVPDTEEEAGRPTTDPQSLIQAIRSSGHDEPVVLISRTLSDELWSELAAENCDVLLTPHSWESKALVPMIKRAIDRAELVRENHRLRVMHHRRLVRERDEAEHLLDQQRRIIEGLRRPRDLPHPDEATPATDADTPEAPETETVGDDRLLPREVGEFYDELLRTYVIMGSGSLGTEIARLADVIVAAGLGPREAMRYHLQRVEYLVKGLGNRSARHVMARADLLAMELIVHVGERHRQGARPAD